MSDGDSERKVITSFYCAMSRKVWYTVFFSEIVISEVYFLSEVFLWQKKMQLD